MQIRENSSARDLIIVSNERIVVDLAAIRAISEEHERLNKQIDKLAKFIMEHVEGEPSQSQGAVDTAIRLLKDRDRLRAALKLLQEAWAESWDCSRDPGHTLMSEAMEQMPALERRDD